MMIAFTFNCICQPKTISVDRGQLVKAITKAQQAKIYVQEIDQFKIDTALLSYRIAEKQSIIDNLTDKDEINKKIISTYEAQIQVMEGERKILEDQINLLDKKVKKFHRKLLWRSVEGIGLAVAAFFLGKGL